MSKRIDLTGQRFGRLVVEGFAYVSKNREAMWNCKCDCGKRKVVRGHELRRGDTISCGCYRREVAIKKNYTHGESHSKLYKVWCEMIARTENTKNKRYYDYGGRGVTVCKEWRDDYQAFHNWAIEHGYREGLTIERIDVNGNYCPENCRWATWGEQALNKRNNVKIEYQGETMILAQWSKKLGMSKDVLRHRLYKLGWSIEKAFETPLDEQKSGNRKKK